ncbi:hypothetical protein [Mangrovibrevibacter kandeliae]|uniref:hypothetical protein n=1 Tax=Mangrovibrevibacter kandeliae TaxID=2968473 RepID=UPI002117FB5B|nr:MULTISPECIES: hypothetical protein [unclassified Aurantimonas]MCQ8783455.1 hypothetical protein [Aurantimonas sp. CSK15Z-1]MCW4116029.1 hypothetical protein [Aurantimonas sp. MSK8Z-1]
MPGLAEILRQFQGAALLMRGKEEGLKLLDLSADGFWTSFFAIVVALPPMILSWIEFQWIEAPGSPDLSPDPVDAYAAHAIADLIAWILPVAILMLLARRMGMSRKIGPLVVASNWGGALLAWIFSPYWVLLILAGRGPATSLLGLLATIASIILTVRLVSLSIGRDLPIAVAVVALMVIASLVSYGLVMDVTGVPLI